MTRTQLCGVLPAVEPQVYVHVGVEGLFANQVIRIGCAKNGAYNSWFTSGNGHKNVFFWAIGESDQYGSINATSYSNYLLFCAELYGIKTKL